MRTCIYLEKFSEVKGKPPEHIKVCEFDSQSPPRKGEYLRLKGADYVVQHVTHYLVTAGKPTDDTDAEHASVELVVLPHHGRK